MKSSTIKAFGYTVPILAHDNLQVALTEAGSPDAVLAIVNEVGAPSGAAKKLVAQAIGEVSGVKINTKEKLADFIKRAAKGQTAEAIQAKINELANTAKLAVSLAPHVRVAKAKKPAKKYSVAALQFLTGKLDLAKINQQFVANGLGAFAPAPGTQPTDAANIATLASRCQALDLKINPFASIKTPRAPKGSKTPKAKKAA